MSSNFAGSMVLILDPREALSFELAERLEEGLIQGGFRLDDEDTARPSATIRLAGPVSALELVASLRRGSARRVIFVVTEDLDRASVVRFMRAGADDVIAPEELADETA